MSATQKHFRRLSVVLGFLVVYLISPGADAATITPPSPTEQDVITASIDVVSSTIYDSPSTSLSGNVIRTNLTILGFDTSGLPFTTHILASFGPLAQGTYTYQVYQVFQGQTILVSQQTFVVAPPIPTLNGLYKSILAIALAAIGVFAHRAR